MPDYEPARLAQVLDELRRGRNESYRETSLRAGLDHGALRRYICDGRRPQRQALIALADHFGVNPNELLPLAGYPPMKLFQRVVVDPDSLPSDVGALVQDLQRIPDRTQRRKLVEAMRVLIAGYMSSQCGEFFERMSIFGQYRPSTGSGHTPGQKPLLRPVTWPSSAGPAAARLPCCASWQRRWPPSNPHQGPPTTRQGLPT